MMIPEVGGIIVVRGKRIAIPAEGPIPGRTPISVPTRQPQNAQRRVGQARAGGAGGGHSPRCVAAPAPGEVEGCDGGAGGGEGGGVVGKGGRSRWSPYH